MRDLEKQATQRTPQLNFKYNEGILEFKGLMIPFDDVFFSDIKNWLEEYLKNPQPKTELRLYLKYINSLSSKFLLNLFHMLEHIIETSEVVIKWFYEEEGDIQEEGWDEYKEYTIIPIEFLKA